MGPATVEFGLKGGWVRGETSAGVRIQASVVTCSRELRKGTKTSDTYKKKGIVFSFFFNI